MKPYQESQFRFDDRSSGMLVLPQRAVVAPAVLLLHGFASQADEVGGFYVRLADRLASAGIASLRFTFRGFEQPPEALIESSIGEMVAEAEDAFSGLAAHPRINPARIGLLGFSLGGVAAILAAAREAQRFKSLATWSCGADLERRFRALAGEAAFERALAGEAVAMDLGWRTILLGGGFFSSLVGCRPEAAIRDWTGPFLAIAGGADELSEHLDEYFHTAKGAVKDKLLIPGADHIFDILEDPERYAPRVIEKTVDWFSKTL